MKIYKTLDEAIVARHEEWDDGKTDLCYAGLELSGEAGEAANKIKKLVREERGMPGSRTTEEDVLDELADVIICARRVALKLGKLHRLDEAVHDKFNRTSRDNGLETRVEAAPAAHIPDLPEDEIPF